jgi:hypothetical protein
MSRYFLQFRIVCQNPNQTRNKRQNVSLSRMFPMFPKYIVVTEVNDYDDELSRQCHVQYRLNNPTDYAAEVWRVLQPSPRRSACAEATAST